MEEARLQGVVSQMLRRAPVRRPGAVRGPEKFSVQEGDETVDIYNSYNDGTPRFFRNDARGNTNSVSTKQRRLAFTSAGM